MTPKKFQSLLIKEKDKTIYDKDEDESESSDIPYRMLADKTPAAIPVYKVEVRQYKDCVYAEDPEFVKMF